MSNRSIIFTLLGVACVALIIIDDASAWRRRCLGRFSRCGVSRSASWGGSYGSCGGPVSRQCGTVCNQVPTQPCSISFGSGGGSGGSYASVGSAGGPVIISDVLLYTSPGVATDTLPTPSQPTPAMGEATLENPIDILVPEHHVPEGAKLESDPEPHLHLEQPTPAPLDASENSTSNSNGTPAAKVAHATPADQHAFLVLRDVPLDAEVYLLGVKMTARGELRRYRIPLLSADVQYDYQVELRLPLEDDRSATVTTKVSAGQTTQLWVARAGDQMVLRNKEQDPSHSTPLAIK